MKINSFVARQFRNISTVSLTPSPRLNLLVGENGQGKTNLLEAIYFLANLKSFRTSISDQLVQENATESQLEAQIETLEKPRDLKLRFGGKRRVYTVGDKIVDNSQLHAQLKVVLFSPESLLAIKMGPEYRRELLDEAVRLFDLDAFPLYRQYGRALKQRNALLKQIKTEQISKSYGRQMLEALDVGFVDLASHITAKRVEYLRLLKPYISNVFSALQNGQHQVELQYLESEAIIDNASSYDELRQRFLVRISDPKRRLLEETLGASLTGPHRHDLKFLFNGNDSRFFASQGQQRTLILSFKIGEIMYHDLAFKTPPVLLLDDVLSELDEAKQKYLVRFLGEIKAQTFVTTTEIKTLGRFRNEFETAVFQVANGNIARRENDNSDRAQESIHSR